MASVAHASQVVIQDIKFRSQEGGTLIEMTFGTPLRYIKHFPQTYGEILQIKMALGEEVDREIHKEVRQAGELVPPEGQEALLVYVTYEEGVPGGPFITLRFATTVQFEVNGSTGSQTLQVMVRPVGDKAQEEESIERSKVAGKNIDSMMAKARQAITFGNSGGAAQVLMELLELPEHRHTQDARELLGLAYERSERAERAREEYAKYIQLYPKSEGAERVRQRLTALEPIVDKREKLRQARQTTTPDRMSYFGQWSQNYSLYYTDETPEDKEVNVDPPERIQSHSLFSYLNFTARYRSKERTVQGVFAGSNNQDFVDGERTETRLRSMYVDVDDKEYGYVAKLGRQSASGGGAFGTFDGVVAGYRVAPRWLVSGYYGKPEQRGYGNTPVSAQTFSGVKAAVEGADRRWGVNSYFVSQETDGMTDRQALGVDARYAGKTVSLYGYTDYDVLYQHLSMFDVVVGWQYVPSSRINISYNRRSLVQASAALSGSGAYTVAELRRTLSEREIRDLAEARIGLNETLTLTNSYNYSPDTQIGVTISAYQAASLPGFAWLELRDGQPLQIPDPLNSSLNIDNPADDNLTNIGVQPAYGPLYNYSWQWMSNNVFGERDFYMVGFNYAPTPTSSGQQIYVNARLTPVGPWQWQCNVRLSDSSYKKSATHTSMWMPSVRVDYRLKGLSFNAELGASITDYSGSEAGADRLDRHVLMGYNYTF